MYGVCESQDGLGVYLVRTMAASELCTKGRASLHTIAGIPQS
jgi:hypothetical protein